MFESSEINWPSVVKYNQVEELLFVGSQQQWQASPEFSAGKFLAGDVLIDSDGKVYPLHGDRRSARQANLQNLSLDEVLDLVRQHASVCGHCCVSKMGAPSIRAALQLVEVIE